MSILEKLFTGRVGRHTGTDDRSLRLPPPKRNRSLPVLERICRQHGSPFGAAIHGEITAEEYLAVTENPE